MSLPRPAAVYGVRLDRLGFRPGGFSLAGGGVRAQWEHAFVSRCHAYKLKPTAAQVLALLRYLTVTRLVYNAALEQRQTAFRLTGRSPGWIVQKREIKELRAAGLLDGCHVHTVQAALRRLDRAFARFFAGRSGYPRFKAARHWRSFEFFEHGNGWRLETDRARLRIAGVGRVRVRLHRLPAGTVKTLTVLRKADGWYAHIVCDLPAAPPRREPSCAALDVGVQALATLHTGEAILNPRHLDRAARKLGAEQRALARKRRGSRRVASRPTGSRAPTSRLRAADGIICTRPAGCWPTVTPTSPSRT